MTHLKRAQGFTLVEVAIVLGIIALLIGGIVVGQSVIHAANLRSLVSDVQIANEAITQFKEKYGQFPGDMSNATDYWGTGAACADPGCLPRKETFDGNGDGRIYNGVGYSGGITNETYLLWQHLANAGMIKGQYSGTYYDAGEGYDLGIGVNAPATAIQGATMLAWDGVGEWGAASLPQNNLHVTATPIFQVSTMPYPILRPEDAAGIDKKMDDGRPAYGFVTTPWPTHNSPMVDNSNCVTSGTASTAEYDTSKVGPYCSLGFRISD